jgi:hypothetical protein
MAKQTKESSGDEVEKSLGGFARFFKSENAEVETQNEEEVEVEAHDDVAEKSFACPHCASDITPADVEAGLAKSGKQGKNIPPRTAAAEEQEGFSSGKKNKGGALGGNKSSTRSAAVGKPNPGNVGSYAKSEGEVEQVPARSPFGSPLMYIAKSQGPGGDEEIAAEIARQHGVDISKI